MGDRGGQATLKKLMQIIYQKQKQIDKYRKLARQKQRTKHAQPLQPPHLGLSMQQKQLITREIIENKRFLETASYKLHSMENRIAELQADLEEEENRNAMLEERILVVRAECEDREKVIAELRTMKELLENVKINKNGEISEKEGKIQSLVIENQKIKIISQQIKNQNNTLKQRIRSIETEINKSLKFMHKNLRFNERKNQSHVDLDHFPYSRVAKRSQQQIKTHTFIQEKLEQKVEEKIAETLELMKRWEETLNKRQEQWRRNYEKALSEHSFGGISGLISQSILIKDQPLSSPIKKDPQSQINFYQTSVYKRNQQQLLKQLEQECQKSHIGPISMQKQKLVELSEIKQSLKMTKQVNEQLFDELNKQENIIKAFKETFRSLEHKKLLKTEGNQEIQKLRSVLGVRN